MTIGALRAFGNDRRAGRGAGLSAPGITAFGITALAAALILGGPVQAAPVSALVLAQAQIEADDGAAPAETADPAAAPDAGTPTDDETGGAPGETDDSLADGEETLGAPEDGEDAGAAEDDTATADYGIYTPIATLIEAGGPIIIILITLSVISLAIILVKIVQFLMLGAGRHGFVPAVVQTVRAGRLQDALDQVSTKSAVVAQVMAAAIRGKMVAADGDTTLAREEVERVAQAKLDGLESGLTFLALIATISPLLGLLGTVLGMIDSFQQLEGAGDRVDPAILSGGIWEALLTTAAGLTVAIPAAAFHTWLQRTVDVTAQYMEDAATQVFCADLYAAPPAGTPAAPSETASAT